LRGLLDQFVDFCYQASLKFPSDERFGATSQIRRASLSVPLNYIEGYARRKPKSRLNFLEISYGSLQESKYLLNFSLRHGWVSGKELKVGMIIAEESGAMMWKEIENLSAAVDDGESGKSP